MFTYRYSTNDFFITDIKIAHQNKLLRLAKNTGLSGTSSGVGMDIVDCGNLLREYEISKILNIECIVKDVTNGNEHWKHPLLIRNENIKLILRINVENRRFIQCMYLILTNSRKIVQRSGCLFHLDYVY